MAETPDDILIARAQRGEADAVSILYRRYVQQIARYIGYRVPDGQVVEDLTAEVFLRMVEGLPTYRVTGAPFEAWLYRIAAARVADHYRLHRQRPQEPLTDTLHSDQALSPEQTVQEREAVEELREALSQLPEEQQTILILRFVERKSHEEVAQIVNKSVEATATMQHRALKRLAALMGSSKSGRHYLRGTTE
ncbi:MAG TPA: sigma-70 family RNA polymerase sigma factor [Aggregatilinea sp.]|jgi:RNA polymerase sigma-70 factor (ECF subfamily)|uniref:RNA polymerase sigma factor n=1 Tax=Aggregatilinea sp. TaxID=2806333 RepID=UPI002C6C9E02|nr:sigma-70 family RNA polymerase sigma factor [Aggregatilinea sp.]HML24463.1 sigma-70 family RNA polymerase sigma factor [Aggregatilinea sp.]